MIWYLGEDVRGYVEEEVVMALARTNLILRFPYKLFLESHSFRYRYIDIVR